jgi:hypothetical protein
MTDGAAQAVHAGPPRPGLALSVGMIGEPDADAVQNVVDQTKQILAIIHGSFHRIEPLPWFRSGPARLSFLNSTRQDLTDCALHIGYAIDLVQPLAARETAFISADRRLLVACDKANAAGVDQLPKAAIVAHSDLLIVIWDGGSHCSTADAVLRALSVGTAVIHVPLDPQKSPRLLLAESDIHADSAAPITAKTINALLATILLPPDDPDEKAQLRQFLTEPLPTRNLRIAYPLLLAATGTQRLRRKAWDKSLYLPEVKAEWDEFNALCGDHCQQNSAMLAPLEESFIWANHLGSHYAQTMRSGLIINFTFSALAVLAALASLATSSLKLPLALLEIFIIVVVIVNIRRGSQRGWQRRWLDYRGIAERLRPFRSIKLLGVAGQPRRVQRKGTTPRRWTDWYVAAIWREMGTPQGIVDAQQLGNSRALLADPELASEIAYQRTNARRMRHLEERLHLIGDCSFLATLIVCLLFPALYFAANALAIAWGDIFVMLSAGLPAIGGASYALRVHGDYGGAAGRSLETAAALDGIRTALLAPELSLSQAATLATSAARVMLVDLDEWQMTYAQRSLAIPA